jgi:hypothetical protein
VLRTDDNLVAARRARTASSGAGDGLRDHGANIFARIALFFAEVVGFPGPAIAARISSAPTTSFQKIFVRNFKRVESFVLRIFPTRFADDNKFR